MRQYAKIPSISRAAELCGMDRNCHYDWIKHPDLYPDYANQFAEAERIADHAAEAEVWRRGVVGWTEEQQHVTTKKGRDKDGNVIESTTKEVVKIPRFSERMLELTVKARLPHKYRERLEHMGAGGGPIQVEDMTAVPLLELKARFDSAMRVLDRRLPAATAAPIEARALPAASAEVVPTSQQTTISAQSDVDAYEATLLRRKGGNGHVAGGSGNGHG